MVSVISAMDRLRIFFLTLCLPSGFLFGQIAKLMPRATDQSSIWWAEGFPGVVEGAAWHRVIETGHYAMVLDTETLAIPHFGALNERDWRALPSADLLLEISVNGKSYTCEGSEGWSQHGGPRLVEAGTFFQRADVTDLIFRSKEGESLGVEARFETAAWPDRLGLIFEAGPGVVSILKGEESFGKVGGGFGLDGTNMLLTQKLRQINPNSLTWSFWAYVPEDYDSATKAIPWLMTDGRNEAANGNLGIYLMRGKAVATINTGGGRENQVRVPSDEVKLGRWNHFLLSYDGAEMCFHVNGKRAPGGKVGKLRVDPKNDVIFGRRGDGSGDGYHFVGVIDEVQFHHGVVGPKELRETEPMQEWGFRKDGKAAAKAPREAWMKPELKMILRLGGETLKAQSAGEGEVALVIDPLTFKKVDTGDVVKVEAGKCPVKFDRNLSAYQVDLDGVKGIGKGNNVIERTPFTISNSTDREQVARLMFLKSGRGFRGRLGSSITGVTAMLCDEAGEPTGIPVQLSKNWHNRPEAGVYKGTWFHGITQVRVPAGAKVKLQVVIANGHWGGVAAASHAQLSLIGWGSNQRWEQSALGCWGESICYEPAQGQGKCLITDVRPLMVTPMNGKGQWGWTNNVGGGDFFRFFDLEGKRHFHQAMKTRVIRQGPCLTEVEYSGKIGAGIRHSVVTSLARTDDLVRGIYRVRMKVSEPVDFSRLVIFQIGADTYNYTREKRFVLGNEKGLQKEWQTQPGGDVYRTAPLEMVGEIPWASLEDGKPNDEKGAWANRGMIVREWKARLGGKEAAVHFAERGSTRGKSEFSTIDLVPPAGVTRLEKGDFVEAVIEYVVIPENAQDYYGPSAALKKALKKDGGTWKMIQREVLGNARLIEMKSGKLIRRFPDVRVSCEKGQASYELEGGVGYVPVTFTNLSRPNGQSLKVNGKVVDQSVHGNDFWQTDYDSAGGTWSQTYNLPRDGKGKVLVEFGRE